MSKPSKAATPGVVVDDPMAEWKGMPEFISEDKRPFRSLHIHFASAEDLQRFAEAIGCSVPTKQRWMWYPPRPIQFPSRNPYVDRERAEA